MKVLIAEDHLIAAKMAKLTLERGGCIVDVAENETVVLKKILEKKYDLIFMDIELADKNGMDVAKKIRQLESLNKSTPIIALTAHDTIEIKGQCFDAGMNGFLNKPLRDDRIEYYIKKYG